MKYQEQYYHIIKNLINNYDKKVITRIGMARSSFKKDLMIDLKQEFPIQTIKKVSIKNVIHELLWMLSGDTNIQYLVENGCHIWNDDAYRYYKERYSLYDDKKILKEEFIDNVLAYKTLEIPASRGHIYTYGDLDKIYGHQWRMFGERGVDQINDVIETLRTNPDDRRMIVTAHNPSDLKKGDVGLPSCHNYFQFYTTVNKETNRRELSCFVNIRSNDWFLGQPYNAVQYSILTYIIANIVDMDVAKLAFTIVDCHLYEDHIKQAEEWIKRYESAKESILNQPIEFSIKRKLTSINDIEYKDFELKKYKPLSSIKAPLLT